MIEAMNLATPPLRIRLFAAAHHMANAEVVRRGACLEEVNELMEWMRETERFVWLNRS